MENNVECNKRCIKVVVPNQFIRGPKKLHLEVKFINFFIMNGIKTFKKSDIFSCLSRLSTAWWCGILIILFNLISLFNKETIASRFVYSFSLANCLISLWSLLSVSLSVKLLSGLQRSTYNKLVHLCCFIVKWPLNGLLKNCFLGVVCCVFWPANRCSTRRSLVKINFFMLKQLFLNKKNKESRTKTCNDFWCYFIHFMN